MAICCQECGDCVAAGKPQQRRTKEEGDSFPRANVAVIGRGTGDERPWLPHETIPDTPHRDDLLGVSAKFLPQAGNLRIDGAIESVIVVAPEPPQEVLAAKGAARMRG